MISFLSAYACIVAFLSVFYSFLGILTPTCGGYQPWRCDDLCLCQTLADRRNYTRTVLVFDPNTSLPQVTSVRAAHSAQNL